MKCGGRHLGFILDSKCVYVSRPVVKSVFDKMNEYSASLVNNGVIA